MSVTWYYRCDGHEPPLMESFERISMTYMEKDLEYNRRAVINNLPDFVMENLDNDEVRHWWWLRLHPKCQISLVNEYGQTPEEWRKDRRS